MSASVNATIQIDLTEKQVDLLFPALKTAEGEYTNSGNYKAASEVHKIFNELHKQIYTYGQMEE